MERRADRRHQRRSCRRLRLMKKVRGLTGVGIRLESFFPGLFLSYRPGLRLSLLSGRLQAQEQANHGVASAHGGLVRSDNVHPHPWCHLPLVSRGGGRRSLRRSFQ
jgi:hypothetical protein